MNGFDYKDALNDIKKDISKLELLADDECKKALRECGNVYKSKCAAFSGGTEKFQGIGVGARATVRKSKKGTGHYLVVKGSKKYAPLWHLANNGFVHVGNVKVDGNHFVDKAELASQTEVDGIIEDALNRMIGDKQ